MEWAEIDLFEATVQPSLGEAELPLHGRFGVALSLRDLAHRQPAEEGELYDPRLLRILRGQLTQGRIEGDHVLPGPLSGGGLSVVLRNLIDPSVAAQWAPR